MKIACHFIIYAIVREICQYVIQTNILNTCICIYITYILQHYEMEYFIIIDFILYTSTSNNYHVLLV